MNFARTSLMSISQRCLCFNKRHFTIVLSATFAICLNSCKVKQPADSINKSGEKQISDSYKYPFSLLEAYSQKRISGIAGGASSTEYTFNMIIQTSEGLEFDSLWIGGKVLKVFIGSKSKVISNEPVTFSRNDTVVVRASLSSAVMPVMAGIPVSFSGEALLSYKLNGNKNYYEIRSINKKPDILGQ